MALYNELQVFKDTYTLLKEIYSITHLFAREYKYSLGEDMKKDVMQLFRYLYQANRSIEKREYLEQEQNRILNIEYNMNHTITNWDNAPDKLF